MTAAIRTLLFVPGTRPERFAKALGAGAEAVIIDLEDAVAPDVKEQAREHIAEFAAQNPAARFFVRVNDATTRWFEEDIALCERLPNVSTVVLPKAESAEQVTLAGRSGKPVLPIIESAKGVLALAEIAAAPGVSHLSFGSLDFMLELGTTPDTPAARVLLDHVRTQILMHSAAQGLGAPIDGVYPNFADQEGLAELAGFVRDMGFGGMLCIHPGQVPVITRAFVPTEEERTWAARVVDKAKETGALAFQLDGQMVDAPVIARAKKILAG